MLIDVEYEWLNANDAKTARPNSSDDNGKEIGRNVFTDVFVYGDGRNGLEGGSMNSMARLLADTSSNLTFRVG